MIEPDSIDGHIMLIANALCSGMKEEDIIAAYEKNGFPGDEISLILAAGKLICQDRKDASPLKPIFRRVT